MYATNNFRFIGHKYLWALILSRFGCWDLSSSRVFLSFILCLRVYNKIDKLRYYRIFFSRWKIQFNFFLKNFMSSIISKILIIFIFSGIKIWCILNNLRKKSDDQISNKTNWHKREKFTIPNFYYFAQSVHDERNSTSWLFWVKTQRYRKKIK